MLDTSQSWNLFGYDLRQGWYVFRAGWRDFLWGADSPVLPIIDETVLVYRQGEEPLNYQAGQPAPQAASSEGAKSSAVLLPDNLVLPRMITVPRAAEGNLEAVVEIEVKANSPFPDGDTCYGWSIVSRDDQGSAVQLVISSSSTVMEYIAEQLDCHDVHAHEVWAQIDNNVVVLSGFGEAARQGRNKKRMIRAGMGIAYCLIALVACFAVAAGMKYLELQQVRAIYESTENRAANAVKLRSELSVGKQQVAAVNAIIAKNLDPRTELTRLSRLLDDATWLTGVDIQGTKIRIDGHSLDAAALMQKLVDEPAYEEVSAPAAIRKDSRSRTERFVLDLRLATESDGQ